MAGGSRRELELLNYGKAVQEKKERMEAIYAEQEIAQYNFHPQICKKSELIIMEKAGVQDLVVGEEPEMVPAEEVKKSKFKELYSDAC